MLFNSAQFLIFFPIVVVVYYILPGRVRYIWLLISSYYFYMQWNPAYSLLLLASTLVTYCGALLIERTENARTRKIYLIAGITVNLLMLGFFKYANMVLGYASKLVSLTGNGRPDWDLDIILPVGISFFTLQALGYLIDVYRGDTEAEHNILRYALFISFFPQLVAGPIERSKNLLKQLSEPHKLTYDNISRGLMIMLYGFFLKLVIADRVAQMVNTIYADPYTYSGFYIIVASIAFGLQIYCDFYGYSTIARGAALTMGITLMDNFKAPFYSRSISEFWRRWHISLSTWFRDYLYIPLGGNRRGEVRKYINIMIVFTISGLWHGATMAFVIWGMMHGLYQVLEALFGKLKTFISEKTGYVAGTDNPFSKRLISILFNIALVSLAWPFFRGNSLENATLMFRQMFSSGNWHILFDGSISNIGFSEHLFPFLFLAIVIMGCVDHIKYSGRDAVEVFFAQGRWFRTLAVVFLLLFTLVFGYYGQEGELVQFIYFQF